MWIWLNICRKNIKFVVIRCVLSSSKLIHFQPGLCPWPQRGSLYDAPLRPPSRLGMGTPSPHPSAFGVSIWRRRLSGRNTNSWLRLCIAIYTKCPRAEEVCAVPPRIPLWRPYPWLQPGGRIAVLDAAAAVMHSHLVSEQQSCGCGDCLAPGFSKQFYSPSSRPLYWLLN